ncbi:MAG: phosphate/phosphite/phosphonate ABC transporter substrate-binding protein [Clostridium sp.]|uniref:phosphate/phosphite/phosphonate ABC transporter substrate-binding protein n=1 Tax=Clostridium sp. TaxID=1506 RepID=UPI003EE75B2C
MKFKKIVSLVGAAVLGASIFVGCGASDSKGPEELVVQFVPSRDTKEIEKATEPLQIMLTEKLKEKGFEFKEVSVNVGTNFETVAEALGAGTAHVGFIPGSTYVLHDTGAEALLTATRDSLNHDSDNAKDWNTDPTVGLNDNKADSYRSLIIAGPSEKGQALAKKINNGEKLTVEDIKTVKWAVPSSTTSPAGYVYPSLWLKDNYGINGLGEISDSLIQTPSYADAVAKLAAGQADIMTGYADVRRDYEENWKTSHGKKDIWTETAVVGVTKPIYNDMIAVTRDDEVSPELKNAIKESFLEIAQTPEGKEVIAIYSHSGYTEAKDENYNSEREAQKLLKELNK